MRRTFEAQYEQIHFISRGNTFIKVIRMKHFPFGLKDEARLV